MISVTDWINNIRRRRDAVVLTYCVGVLSLSMAGCTSNDGDIGDLYGRWQVISIATPDIADTPNDLFFSFQSKVIFTSYSHYDLHDAFDYKGTYRHDGDSIFIKYYTTVENASYVDEFMRLRFGFPDCNDVRLHVDRLSSGHMQLSGYGGTWTFRKF